MKRFASILAVATLVACLGASSAEADFGLNGLEVTVTDAGGAPAMQAGSHPFAINTNLAVNLLDSPEFGKIPDGQARNLRVELPSGVIGSPTATPRCEAADFATLIHDPVAGLELPSCSDSSVIGLATVRAATPSGLQSTLRAPVYNLIPPPGQVAKFGFVVLGTQTTFTAALEEVPPYNAFVSVRNIPQNIRFYSSKVVIWGNPSDPSHNEQRGKCGAAYEDAISGKNEIGGQCPTSNPNRPFLTLPTSCGAPLVTSFEAESWLGDTFAQSIETQDSFGKPLGILGCESLGFSPTISAQPSSHSAESASGLQFDLNVKNEGLTSPEGRADSVIKKAEVVLPQGMTLNPSQAEGLGVCTEADFARETASSEFGAGCPSASKVGTVEVESPLLEGEIFKGTLFVAAPYKNPFNSLIALYMTIKDPALGVGIKLAGKVAPDPATGQIITTFGEPGHELPQIAHVSHIRIHLREGARSPLITPALCGTYTTVARLTPWASPSSPYTTTSSFEIGSGVAGAPCPAAAQPFEPGFTAGTLNNAAGSFAPFYARFTRRDGDQDLTKVSATLPLGLVAKLAGVDRCPDAQIALAKTKSGTAELASPSCPANSLIGHVSAGAGVGSELTYVGGKVYLAGPYNGAPISVVEIVPAVAGPFDVGTVVVRQALQINPRTAEVHLDGDHSDPIPHILAGIPLRVRDIRAQIDRPDFTLNPTSCDPTRIGAELWGGGANVFSPADDSPVAREDRFQAAGCQGLGFKPSLALKLKGGTKRGDHPALRAVVRPRVGDANIEGAVVRLPRSAFLDQAHIRTICTRVQFAAGAGHGAQCPAGAVYGHVRAFTPLLSEPLEGPVYLRSSNHNLPDLVFSLRGLVDFEAVGRIDSKHGGIRATFTQVPDAPISKVVLNMQGGKKGLIVNSTDLCRDKHRVDARFSAHNGRIEQIRPLLRARCKKE